MVEELNIVRYSPTKNKNFLLFLFSFDDNYYWFHVISKINKTSYWGQVFEIISYSRVPNLQAYKKNILNSKNFKLLKTVTMTRKDKNKVILKPNKYVLSPSITFLPSFPKRPLEFVILKCVLAEFIQPQENPKINTAKQKTQGQMLQTKIKPFQRDSLTKKK